MSENLNWFHRVFEELIELHDVDEEIKVAHICFDPANQQFYIPVFDEDTGMKMHVLMENFNEIQTIEFKIPI